jgi:hypothetical protein
MIGQTRTIEKLGLLILSPEERMAYSLRIFLIIEQIQQNHSKNLRLLPNRSFYGWATIMAGAYVVRAVQLEFQNQLIYEEIQRNLQSHLVLNANLQVIANMISALTFENPAPPNIVVWPAPPNESVLPSPTHIQFVLETGVVAKIISEYQPMYVPPEVEYQPYDNPPPGDSDDDKNQNPPPIAPPPGSPPTTGVPGSDAPFIISPPYDGIDDGGRTYVPPVVPPWEGDDGQDPTATYSVLIRKSPKLSNGAPGGQDEMILRIGVPGKISGLGTAAPNNPDGSYGILSNGVVTAAGNLGINYQFKIAWPYEEFSFHYVAKIIQINKE